MTDEVVGSGSGREGTMAIAEKYRLLHHLIKQAMKVRHPAILLKDVR